MAFINYTTNQLTIKIVYYGTGLSGKTTNLRYIQANIDRSSRSELICLETETERTFFFDLLPVRAGYIGNFKEQHTELAAFPLVFQYNKRDLTDLIPVETLNNLLNPKGAPFIEAAAITGLGVFETLKEIARMTVPRVREKIFGFEGAEYSRIGQKDELDLI